VKSQLKTRPGYVLWLLLQMMGLFGIGMVLALGECCLSATVSRRRTTSADSLFYPFLDKQNCAAILGDLEERRQTICQKFGYRRANIWYWIQAVRSALAIAWAWEKDVYHEQLGVARHGNR
jgi:hypothetical protein